MLRSVRQRTRTDRRMAPAALTGPARDALRCRSRARRRTESAVNYLLLARLAVGIDDESQGAGEQIALQARAADAGPAGWADLCCFGRDHNEFHTGRSHLCEMISMGDVHALDAGTCLRFEARGKAIFDDAISSEVKRSQSFSLLRLGCEYARFRYGRCGLGPLMVRANSCQL